jgi:hypothetical protein
VKYDNPESGFIVRAADNGKTIHTMLIREGCDGSPHCAMEWYVGIGADYLNDGPNIHFSDSELESLYKAVKAVRKARRS